MSKGTVVVIGSGAGGASAARRLVSAGWDVTLVDDRRWGGACLWRACMPKKALYHSARVAREIRAAEQYGVSPGEVTVDWQSALGWKWHAQETYADDQGKLLSEKGIRLLQGVARFASPDALEVSLTPEAGASDDEAPASPRTERIAFDHCVIATGSRPLMPDVPGVEQADASEDAIGYPELPRSLAIVGGGFIALEMACIFASLGTKVSVIARGPRILDMLDPELGAVVHRRLQAMGVDFYLNARLSAIEGARGTLQAVFEDPAGSLHRVAVERLLMAIGRRPDYSSLALEAADVALDSTGHLVLDAYTRTTNPKVWAVGDAAGGMMQTPVANYEGRYVAESIDSGHPAHADCSSVPICCFTVPQVATVGLSEKAAREAGHDVHVSRTRYEYLGAAIIEDERDGFVKVVADEADGRILGMQVAGPSASDVVYAGALAVRCGLTLAQLGEAVAVHPSFSEAVYWAGR